MQQWKHAELLDSRRHNKLRGNMDFDYSCGQLKSTNLLTNLLRLVGIFLKSENHRNRQELSRSFEWYEPISQKWRFVRKKVQIFGTGPRKWIKSRKSRFWIDLNKYCQNPPKKIEKNRSFPLKKFTTMLPKPRGYPPKIHCNLAGLQNCPSLTSIPSVTSFLEVVTLSVREMMKK